MPTHLEELVTASRQLSLDDRLSLMDQLWESLAPEADIDAGSEHLELSNEDRQIIDARRAELRANSEIALEDAEVRRRIAELRNE
ncbi:MAG: addiction module protein [Planctomycetaceae bacterium]|nr:addiction module protein [Planctomycetaceae bacterium]